jgi:uncharacterized protein (DUF1501 family)
MSSPASRRSVLALLAALPFGLAVTSRRAAAAAEPQPHMRAALASLRAAREHLDKATPDKGGHRASAIVHVDEAIKETEAGIAFDNRH